MSVINTNITSLIAQQNLSKSQSSLTTAMQRLSSGSRINSAKDDAAGQAIANRMTASITGLAQAQRNANDGISVAQTTEGALNQINDNLQRIRELTVQAQNGTNSSDDKASIQAEINQRLDEINRVSEQTNFNGTKVLNADQKLSIQVGANDGEAISINLRQMNATTLGLKSFDITSTLSSSSLSQVTTGATVDVNKTASIQANSYTPAASTPAQTAQGVYALSSGAGYVVKAGDGNYYSLATNTNTGKLTWDSASTAVAAASVDTTKTVSTIDQTAAATEFSTIQYQGTNSTLADGSTTVSGLYKRNDIGAESLNAAGDTLTGYATKGSDGKFYAVTITAGAGFNPADQTTWTSANFTVKLDGTADSSNNTLATEVSAGNIVNPTTAESDIVVHQATIASNADLQNVALDSAPTAAGLYALNDGSGYVVKDSNGDYFAATVAADGKVTWDSSTAKQDASKVNTGAAVTEVKTGTTTVTPTGLGSGESLYKVDGTSQYVVKGTDAKGNTVYTSASLDTSTGAVTKNKDADGNDILKTVDPLAALDSALKQVDSLRSDLGAIQNRFDSAITNLQTNQTNLSAARSRIQDADYSVEVANMTKAQILQQAGTSVLAQANQIPQSVLSLLQ